MTSLLLWEHTLDGNRNTNDKSERNCSTFIVLLSIFNNDACICILCMIQLINNGHTSAGTVKLVDLIKMFD